MFWKIVSTLVALTALYLTFLFFYLKRKKKLVIVKSDVVIPTSIERLPRHRRLDGARRSENEKVDFSLIDTTGDLNLYVQKLLDGKAPR